MIDRTLCEGRNCDKKETCYRYIQLKKLRDERDYYRVYLLADKENIDDECKMYMKDEE